MVLGMILGTGDAVGHKQKTGQGQRELLVLDNEDKGSRQDLLMR